MSEPIQRTFSHYAVPAGVALLLLSAVVGIAYEYRWSCTHLEFTDCTDISRQIAVCLSWGEAEMRSHSGVLLRMECDSDAIYRLCLDDECFGRREIYENGDPHIHLVSLCLDI